MSGVQNLSKLFPASLQVGNNLSDLASISAALTSLGLGTTAAAELARIGAPTLTDWRQGLIELCKTRTWLGQIGAFADGFFDQTNVDVANSVNATYSSSGQYYTNLVQETTQSLPAMTSNNAPSGHVVSASSTYQSSEPVYGAYDQSASTDWVSASGAPQWLQRQTPSAITLAAYALTARSDGNWPRTPYTWTFLGSNDGSTWTTLDTRTAVVFTQSQRQVFQIPYANRGSYAYHRINTTAVQPNSDAYVSIAELEELQQIGPNALDLRSTALALPATPSKGSIMVVVNPLNGATITPGTNLIASIAQNGTAGTITWTQVSLTLSGTTIKGYLIYEANNVALPGAGQGQALKSRVQTTAGTGVQVLGVYAKAA